MYRTKNKYKNSAWKRIRAEKLIQLKEIQMTTNLNKLTIILKRFLKKNYKLQNQFN